MRVLDTLVKSGKFAMAARMAAYGRACTSWAIKRGSLAENPFAALPLDAVEKRDRVLNDDELRAIWLATAGNGSFNAIVRALLPTGQRRKEVAGMTWGELSDDRSAWTLPAARAKNGVAHNIPLSAPMRALIEVNTAAETFGGTTNEPPRSTPSQRAHARTGLNSRRQQRFPDIIVRGPRAGQHEEKSAADGFDVFLQRLAVQPVLHGEKAGGQIRLIADEQ